MAQVYAQNGVVRFLTSTDFFVPVGSQTIEAVVVHDDGSGGSAELRRGTDGTGQRLFFYLSSSTDPIQPRGFDLFGCVETGGGVTMLVTSGDDIFMDMYVR